MSELAGDVAVLDTQKIQNNQASMMTAIQRSPRMTRAAVLGLVLYLVSVGPLGATGSMELALLCWLAGAAFILLVETSPI